MARRRIFHNQPTLLGHELDYIRQAVDTMHTSGDGPFTRRCADLLQTLLSVPQVLLTTSCTDALEMCALLLDIEPGDEVVVPSFAFVSTVNAFVLRGARPVFADVRPDTLNLDETRLEALLTPRTKAIVALHYAGVGCEMDPILEIASRRGVPVVEDNAHGLFATYRGRHLGTFGCLATQSFHETKNLTCGEGGALLVNDESLVERAEIIRDKGTDRGRFYRGQVDKYSWVDLGSSYVLSDILAAFLYAQLESRDAIQHKRAELWNRYHTSFSEWAPTRGVQLPSIPEHCEQSYHMYYLVLPTLEMRQALIEHLKSERIDSVFHYVPLHLSEMGRKFGGTAGQCPVTERVSDGLIRLPFHNQLSASDQERVVTAVRSYFGD